MEQHQRGIQTVEQAGEILNLVCCSAQPLSLSEICAALELAPATAYKYLMSLLRTGLLKRNESTHEFEAGSLALRLGLAKIRHNKYLKSAQIVLTDLAEQYRLSVYISAWSGQNGPTVIFSKHVVNDFSSIGMKLGTRLSLHETASGRVFAAYIDQELLEKYASSKELSALEKLKQIDFKNNLEEIRQTQVSLLTDIPISGTQSLAVPIFDANGKFVICVATFNQSHELSDQQQQTIIQKLHKISADNSW